MTSQLLSLSTAEMVSDPWGTTDITELMPAATGHMVAPSVSLNDKTAIRASFEI